MDWLLALEQLRRLTGPNGEYLPEATSDEASPTNYDSGWGVRVTGPFTNYFERARLDTIKAYEKAAGKDANLNGMYWAVERVDY